MSGSNSCRATGSGPDASRSATGSSRTCTSVRGGQMRYVEVGSGERMLPP